MQQDEINPVPVFWLLWEKDEQIIIKLMQYQWRHYGLHLEIPPHPRMGEVTLKTQLESLEEIKRIMSRPPRHPRKVK